MFDKHSTNIWMRICYYLMKIEEYLILFLIGGVIYYCIEVAFRGYSHLSMFILGGICLILIGLVNELFTWDMFIEIQVSIGLGVVLVLEFVTGCIVNLWLGWNVWDYSNLPLNLLGQICVPFALLWIPLVLFAILLDDFIRYKWFSEEKPRYTSFIYKKIKSLIHK